MYDSSDGSKDWDNFDLESSGGTKTIRPYLSKGTPKTADVVVAVDYSLWGIKWKRSEFRFVGIHDDNWQWAKQPVGEIEPKIDEAITLGIAQHKEAISHQHLIMPGSN